MAGKQNVETAGVWTYKGFRWDDVMQGTDIWQNRKTSSGVLPYNDSSVRGGEKFQYLLNQRGGFII
jgi:hypothetical protein